jgi:hypothetical protein
MQIALDVRAFGSHTRRTMTREGLSTFVPADRGIIGLLVILPR